MVVHHLLHLYDHESKKYVTIQDDGYLNAVGSRQVLNEVEGRVQNIHSSQLNTWHSPRLHWQFDV